MNHQYRSFYNVWLFQSLIIACFIFPLVDSTLSLVFALLVSIIQGALFSLPQFLLCRFISPSAKYRSLILNITAATLIIMLASNYRLYAMYGFFFNSFVFNILITPGGIGALGATNSMFLTASLIGLIIFALTWIINKFIPSERIFNRFIGKKFAGVICLAFVFQVGIYALSEFKSNSTILHISDKTVWYITITSKSTFKKLGMKRPAQLGEYSSSNNGSFKYPTEDFNLEIKNKYNIIWLVSESLRWDMLSETIMPNTLDFAQTKSQYLLNHYSSGNGTRMGMFGMFYGIYGSNWFDFLHAQKGPVLLHALRKADYQMQAFTSASFTYPEFNKTIFSEFPVGTLTSDEEGISWERDIRNVGRVIDSIETAKDNNKPFFSFMFFEATHANYNFPEESIIREDYLKNLDYVTTDFAENIVGIKARYENAAHHLDQQFNRIFDYLESNNLLDNTIIIITGDHGEEFMENGYWGHNSTFAEHQIRTPMVMYFPSKAPASYEHMTSHLDVPATIMHALGIDANSDLYSHGFDLLDENYHRESIIVSDWHGNALITPEYKLVLSSKGRAHGTRLTDINDQPMDKLPDGANITLENFLKTLPRFNN